MESSHPAHDLDPFRFLLPPLESSGGCPPPPGWLPSCIPASTHLSHHSLSLPPEPLQTLPRPKNVPHLSAGTRGPEGSRGPHPSTAWEANFQMGDPPAHPANGCPPSPPSNPTRQHRPAFWGPSPPWQHSAGSPPVAPLALCSLTESAVREGCPRPGLCRGEGGATS